MFKYIKANEIIISTLSLANYVIVAFVFKSHFSGI